MELMKKAIIIYGPPGSGKSTQAELVARSTGSIHFDTGRYIKGLLEGPTAKTDPILKRERKLAERGILCTPSWVLRIVKEAVGAISASGAGIVFSGSPRTMYEAFDAASGNGLLKTLADIYGKRNVVIFRLVVKDGTSMRRNTARFLCSVCGLPRLASAKGVKNCSFCGGRFKKRKDDNAKVMRMRLKEYRERTEPIIARAKREGYAVKRVNGEKLPFEIHLAIRKALKL